MRKKSERCLISIGFTLQIRGPAMPEFDPGPVQEPFRSLAESLSDAAAYPHKDFRLE